MDNSPLLHSCLLLFTDNYWCTWRLAWCQCWDVAHPPPALLCFFCVAVGCNTHVARKNKVSKCVSLLVFLIAFRYKKNLKALYMVHPTRFVKIILAMIKPLIRSVGLKACRVLVLLILHVAEKRAPRYLLICSVPPDRKLTKSFVGFSAKFGRKLVFINYLYELDAHLHFDQLPIPQRVQE